MSEYRSPDPIDVACPSCGCPHTLSQTWKEPAVAQSLECKRCGQVVWSNRGGRRRDSTTGREYLISGEYQGSLTPKTRTPESLQNHCEHDYQRERIMGAQTGDWKCVKCGHVAPARPK